MPCSETQIAVCISVLIGFLLLISLKRNIKTDSDSDSDDEMPINIKNAISRQIAL